MRYVYVLMAFAILLGFHHMMMEDKARLCSNDATAFEGC